MSKRRKPRKPETKQFRITPKTEGQQDYWDALRDNSIRYLAVTGLPGSGKTLLAAQAAADAFTQKKCDKIYLTRSITAVDGEDIGFLPGDVNFKLDPWLACINQHLKKVLPNYKYLVDTHQIEFLPITYMRGLSLDNAFIIASEAQNLTLDIIKCIMTRIDFRSKIVFEGDWQQSDRKSQNNEYKKFCELFDGKLDSFEWIQLTEADVVRSRDIVKILDIFEGS